ncbi:uncharacterized protein [Petaurus breviceps papuanus]|uniref:uncharacterized protein isoform X2 n=1 Tax=Petaurus breviceps papuanus TaxID=3040969 RepID=UPI0036DEC482
MFLGPQRCRKWFGRQNNYRRSIWNSSKPSAFHSITRRFDRNNAASEENSNSESTARQFKNPGSQPERLGRQLTLGPENKSLPINAERAMKQKEQRENQVNQNQEISPQNVRTDEEKSPSQSRHQVQMKPGSVLTVSITNLQVGQNKEFKRTFGETSFQKDESNSPKPEKFQPKEIPLRYNFQDVANQTKFVPSERFSIKVDFAVTTTENRTVTLI